MSDPMIEIMQVINRYKPKDFHPKVGIILGSGLSSLAEQISNPVSIPYQALPGLAAGNVVGHAYLLVFGYLHNVPIVCLRGRLHAYEGIPYETMRLLVRIIKHVGCSVFMVTAAAGSMQMEAGPGELMMITDHINFQPGNPLVGPNDESIGPRFVPMDNVYDNGLQESLRIAAERIQIPLYEGVYISVLGPSFETPAEIRAFQQWGADMVGMSVVPEVIAARHCGLRVAGVAAITNFATGLSDEKVTHEVTLQYGELAARKLIKLIPAFLQEIADDIR